MKQEPGRNDGLGGPSVSIVARGVTRSLNAPIG